MKSRHICNYCVNSSNQDRDWCAVNCGEYVAFSGKDMEDSDKLRKAHKFIDENNSFLFGNRPSWSDCIKEYRKQADELKKALEDSEELKKAQKSIGCIDGKDKLDEWYEWHLKHIETTYDTNKTPGDNSEAKG
jgi:hypothetical protein